MRVKQVFIIVVFGVNLLEKPSVKQLYSRMHIGCGSLPNVRGDLEVWAAHGGKRNGYQVVRTCGTTHYNLLF
jgi:hypothetical protein